MSVLIVTSLGDIVVNLHTDRCPLTCNNFLKLCKIKYYNGCLFYNVQNDFIALTGDPTGTGSGGDSIYKYLYGDQARYFGDEIHLDLKHSKTGTVAMASAGQNLNASQFYMTLCDDLDYLDEKYTIFGEVAKGLETLSRINEACVDEKNRPYKDIRIKHTYILDDPFDDPPQLAELVRDAFSEGKPKDEVDDEVRLEDDWVPMDEQLVPGELEEVIRTKEAHSRAVVLESIGDIPDAEIKPPENVLFVCKLNPVTKDEDLHTIFSRFGTVTLAEIIRDFKTGDSLCYAFIEFEDTDACNQAYHKMDNALIDDRRIHVDFSQSVAKLWSQYRCKDQQNGNTFGQLSTRPSTTTQTSPFGGTVQQSQPLFGSSTPFGESSQSEYSGSGTQPAGEVGSTSSAGIAQAMENRGVSLIEIFGIVDLNVHESLKHGKIFLRDNKGYQILYKSQLSRGIPLQDLRETCVKYKDELLVNVRGPTSSFNDVVLVFDLFDYGYTQSGQWGIEYDYSGNLKIEVEKDMDEVFCKECRMKSKDGMGAISVLYGMFTNGTVAQLKFEMLYCSYNNITVNGCANVYGIIVASNSKLDMESCTSLLFLKKPGDGVTIGDDGIIPLTKSGVAVPIDSYLYVDISVYHGTVHHKESLKFRSQTTGQFVRCTPMLHDGNAIQVTVNWMVDPNLLLSFYDGEDEDDLSDDEDEDDLSDDEDEDESSSDEDEDESSSEEDDP